MDHIDFYFRSEDHRRYPSVLMGFWWRNSCICLKLSTVATPETYNSIHFHGKHLHPYLYESLDSPVLQDGSSSPRTVLQGGPDLFWPAKKSGTELPARKSKCRRRHLDPACGPLLQTFTTWVDTKMTRLCCSLAHVGPRKFGSLSSDYMNSWGQWCAMEDLRSRCEVR